MAPVRELMREKGKSGKEGLEAAKKDVRVLECLREVALIVQGFKLRPLTMNDFILHDSHAYAHVEPSRKTAESAWAEPVD